jgi:hypothetical protein
MAINFLQGVTTTNFTATNFTPGAGTIVLGAGSAAIGSVTITSTPGLTDTQLRASAVPVSLASVPTHAVTLTSTTITGTVAVSNASLPLPTGASTSAKQPALGVAGTASTDVLTIQGIASMTALKVDGSAVTQPVSLASVPTHAVTLTSTTITGTVASTQSGTWNIGSITTLPALATGANVIGAVTQSGTWNDVITGNVAAGSAASGNPVRIGAVARTTNPTAVTDGQVSNFRTNKVGDTISIQAPRELVGMQTTTITTTTETTVLTAGGAGVFCDISSMSITNSSATAVQVSLKDATAGTTRQTWWIPAGGGGPMSFNPPLPQTTANNNWTITLGAAVTSIFVNVTYIKNI